MPLPEEENVSSLDAVIKNKVSERDSLNALINAEKATISQLKAQIDGAKSVVDALTIELDLCIQSLKTLREMKNIEKDRLAAKQAG